MHPTILHLAAREHANDLLREAGYRRQVTRSRRWPVINRPTRRLWQRHTPRPSAT